jgi:hypothetical protein
MTIKIEPSPALEAMLERVADKAVRKARQDDVAELKAKIREQAQNLATVPTPFGPTGDMISSRLDDIGTALRELAREGTK